MDKQQVFIYAIASLGLVLVGGVVARFVFVWMDEFLISRSSKKEKDLERMVLREEVSLRVQLGEAPQLPGRSAAKSAEKKQDPARLQIEKTTDPADKERRALMQRIFEHELTPRPQEDPQDFYRRLLGVEKDATAEECKKAFKKMAQKLHPDSFNLAGFDPKTKKRLEKRVHENYLVLQKALDSLKK